MLQTILEFLLYGLFTNSGTCSFMCWPAVAGYLFYAPDDKSNELPHIYLQQLIARCVIFSVSRLTAVLIWALIFYTANDFGKIFFGKYSYIINLITGSIVTTLGLTLLIPATHNNNSYSSHSSCSIKNTDIAPNSATHQNKNIFALGFITGIFPCAPRIVIIATAAIGSDNFYELIPKTLAFSVGEVLTPFVIVAGWWAVSMGMKNFNFAKRNPSVNVKNFKESNWYFADIIGSEVFLYLRQWAG